MIFVEVFVEYQPIACMKMMNDTRYIIGKYIFGQDGIWNIGIDGLYF